VDGNGDHFRLYGPVPSPGYCDARTGEAKWGDEGRKVARGKREVGGSAKRSNTFTTRKKQKHCCPFLRWACIRFASKMTARGRGEKEKTRKSIPHYC